MTSTSNRHRVDDADWRTVLVSIPPAEVLLLTSLFESCDNLALVRTVDPAKGQLAIWFHAGVEVHVTEQLAWLGERMPLVVLERTNGMKHLPGVPDTNANA